MDEAINNTPKYVVPADWENSQPSKLKVIGVGGCGCNAVKYMFNQKITGCTFYACNTDEQALVGNPVPTKIQLGEGKGAGTDPIAGRKAALESVPKIEEALFSSETDILFVTAGMGGGTGTGAAPVIANLAKTRGILTIGVIVTPFDNDGNEAISRALDGIKELEKNVDSLLIVNNQKINEHYGEKLVHEAFPLADEVLATAIRSITDIINIPGDINVDIKDIKNMMKDSGMTLMGIGVGTGENRIEEAVKGAMEYPLLQGYDLKSAKEVLINVTSGKNEKGLRAKELDMITSKINEYTGNANNFKRGLALQDDPEVGDKVQVTVIVTGFKMGKYFQLKENYGNFIMIKDDFTYKNAVAAAEGIENEDMPIECRKVTFSNSTNKPKFSYEEKEKPVLVIEPGKSISEVEATSAIRRRMIAKSK